MTATAKVRLHEFSFDFSKDAIAWINHENVACGVGEIEEYINSMIKYADETEAVTDEEGSIIGVIVRKFSANDPVEWISAQIKRALNSLWNWCPFGGTELFTGDAPLVHRPPSD